MQSDGVCQGSWDVRTSGLGAVVLLCGPWVVEREQESHHLKRLPRKNCPQETSRFYVRSGAKKLSLKILVIFFSDETLEFQRAQ